MLSLTDVDVVMREVVSFACELCCQVQAGMGELRSISKQDRSPVTVADFGAQALVSARLAQAFSDIPLVGEEDAQALRANDALADEVTRAVWAVEPELSKADVLAAIDAGTAAGGPADRFWVLDPIDGTKGFLRGEQYAVALALLENGRVVAGVLGCPSLPLSLGTENTTRGCMYSAVLGQGTWEWPLESAGGDSAPRRVRVADTTDASQAVVCESVEPAHSDRELSGLLARRLGIASPAVRIDSQCKYAVLARGEASVYLRLPTRSDYVEKIWDHAAGSLILSEAGGQVSDIEGRPLDFSRGRLLAGNTGVIATNGLLHAAVLAALQESV